MPTDRVLIEIVTAANMAGVKEAKAGFLGMNPAILGAGIALAILVKIGKDAIDNTKAQETAFLGLNQAVGAYNSNLGKNSAAHKVWVAATSATVKQQANLISSNAKLKLATDEVSLAQAKLTQAVYWYGPASVKTQSYRLALERANVRLAAAEQKLGAAAGGTAAHYKEVAATHRLAAISLEEYRKRVEAFISTNQAYIGNQYDVIAAAAALVRAGNNERDSLRLLNDALDLAVIKTEPVTTAELSLERALQGNAKALKELGISTQYATIMKNKHLTTEQKHLAILTLIETRTKSGRKATDDLTQSQNKLNIAWQTFTTNIGPGVTSLFSTIITDAAELVGWLDLITQYLSKLGAKGASASAATASNFDQQRYGKPAGPHDPGRTSSGKSSQATIHVHGPVTLVTPAAHAKTVASNIRRNDRAVS